LGFGFFMPLFFEIAFDFFFEAKTKIPNRNFISWIWNLKYFGFRFVYFPLLASEIYFSNAIVIDGVSGVGARMSILSPFSKAAF